MSPPPVAAQVSPEAHEALTQYKEATLNVILSRIPDISTFAQLGELIGYSHEWVRQRLVQAPERLYKNGKRYKVPKGKGRPREGTAIAGLARSQLQRHKLVEKLGQIGA